MGMCMQWPWESATEKASGVQGTLSVKYGAHVRRGKNR